MTVGGLHIPAVPAIPGYQTFKGDMWHAAQWRHDVGLSGKRVGIIGNGCSGAQIVPAISEDSSVQVMNFCRTPSWFVPRVCLTAAWFQSLRIEFLPLLFNQVNHNLQRVQWLFRYLPFASALYRFWIYFTVGFPFRMRYTPILIRRL